MLLCMYGHGGFIADFLGSAFWTPLARLSYCVYLFHANVLPVLFLSNGPPVKVSPVCPALVCFLAHKSLRGRVLT